MVAARLSAALLAPKGEARPATGAYLGTGLEPLVASGRGAVTLGSFPARSEPRLPPAGGSQRPTGARNPRPRLSVTLDAEHHRRLRILAARRGRPPHELLRDALAAVLREDPADCPCVRDTAECCGGRIAAARA